MRVLSVVHHVDLGSGVFADEVLARGHDFEEWLPSRAPLARPLGDYDAVIAFGGFVHAYHEERHPWLLGVLDVLRSALDIGLPTLGVCLGAQLLARAAGGTVAPAPRAEWGWQRVTLTSKATSDSLLGAGSADLRVFQWHFDQFTLPPRAVILAHSPVSLQAFRVGPAAWGVQWHPEVTPETVLLLGERYPPAPGGVPVAVDLGRLRADIRRNIADTNAAGRATCARFVEIASGRTGRAQASSRVVRVGRPSRPPI